SAAPPQRWGAPDSRPPGNVAACGARLLLLPSVGSRPWYLYIGVRLLGTLGSCLREACVHRDKEVCMRGIVGRMQLLEGAGVVCELGVEGVLMLHVIDDGAVDLTEGEAGEVVAHLLRSLATRARRDEVVQQHTATSDEEIAIHVAYQQIGIHGAVSSASTARLSISLPR